jgi:hypothetical protein
VILLQFVPEKFSKKWKFSQRKAIKSIDVISWLIVVSSPVAVILLFGLRAFGLRGRANN